MDNAGCNKVQSVMRKVKKKQVKDELDRQKQAEKKKRRLEKALATSAAIISELEKKKQKKKEEQERLDEEGAAIAEAVALHVLIGEEDSSDEIVPWDYSRSIDVYVGQDSPAVCSIEGIGWVTNGFRSGRNEWSFSSRRDFRGPSSYLEGAAAAELIAAQAVKSLQIADEDTIVINDMMRQ